MDDASTTTTSSSNNKSGNDNNCSSMMSFATFPMEDASTKNSKSHNSNSSSKSNDNKSSSNSSSKNDSIDANENNDTDEIIAVFHSGINLSGVSKIYIRIAAQGTGKPHEGAIQRIHLEFHKPLQPHEPKSPFYDGVDSFEDGSTERILEIKADNPVVSVIVWQNDSFVEAIAFEMKSGAISEFYGRAPEVATPHHFYPANCPGAELTGICGEFGTVLRNICFVWETTKKKEAILLLLPMDQQHDASHTYSTMQRQAKEDAWVGRAIFVGIFISSVLASLISSSSRRN